MEYCKVRSIESLDNEYGFRFGGDCAPIKLDFYAEKRMIVKYANKSFCMGNIDDRKKLGYSGNISLVTDNYVELENDEGIDYCFCNCMLVNGGIMDSEGG